MSRQCSRGSGCFFGRFSGSHRGNSSSRRSRPPPPSQPGVTGADSDAEAARGGGVGAEARSRLQPSGRERITVHLFGFFFVFNRDLI